MAELDLQVRFGPMVPLADLARLFLANQRAMRSALNLRHVPIFEVGSSVVVPLRMVEDAFGLSALLSDEDRHLDAVRRAAFRDDGSRKPIAEYAAEVDARADDWLADIERVRAAGPG